LPEASKIRLLSGEAGGSVMSAMLQVTEPVWNVSR